MHLRMLIPKIISKFQVWNLNFRAYDEAKYLVKRLNEFSDEYQKNTDKLESFDALKEAQKWLFEN